MARGVAKTSGHVADRVLIQIVIVPVATITTFPRKRFVRDFTSRSPRRCAAARGQRRNRLPMPRRGWSRRPESAPGSAPSRPGSRSSNAPAGHVRCGPVASGSGAAVPPEVRRSPPGRSAPAGRGEQVRENARIAAGDLHYLGAA
jgi:hypothetical protein